MTVAPARALYDDEGRFIGHQNGCGNGEHRTTGQRAWCLRCTEWCYASAPCAACERAGNLTAGEPLECSYCLALVRPSNLSLHEERCRDLGALLLRFEEGV